MSIPVQDFCLRGSCDAMSKSILESFGLKIKLPLLENDQEYLISSSENSISNNYPLFLENSMKLEILHKNITIFVKPCNIITIKVKKIMN